LTICKELFIYLFLNRYLIGTIYPIVGVYWP
jgi:hypothetical protein